jgi:hypothetical protein
MTTTIQRVRQLQEEIKAREIMLAELSQQPEYLAEQAFIQDVMDVLEMHGRTLKEAVLAIDPSLLGSAPKAPKAKRPYTPRKPKDVEPFSLKPEPKPAPKVSPFATFGQSASAEVPAPAPGVDGAEHPLEPEPKKPAKAVRAKRQSSKHNAARNAKRRVEMIQAGRWFLYTNPHTGETHEAARQGDDLLRGWAAEFGKVTVEGWKRPITPEEAGL